MRAAPRIPRDLVKWRRRPNDRLRPKHREFIRSLPCLACGLAAPSDVLHRCDNPACVNPDHLEVGTHIKNMADMRARGRSGGGRIEGNPKISAAAVEEIKKAYAAGGTYAGLARRFGLKSKSSIANIVRGITWERKRV